MLTSKDIARLAGVSQSTVSRVLQNKPNVRKETRNKILAVLDGTGYVANEQARAMRTRRTGTIGVVTGRITNPFYPELIDALGTSLTRHGLRMVLWATDANSGETAAIDAMRGGLVDGLLFTSATPGTPSLETAMRLKLPVVLVIRSIEGAPCDQVTSDNMRGGSAAAAHFLSSGRTDVAVLGGHDSPSTGRERRAGFVEHFRRNGIEIPTENLISSDFSHDAAKAAARALLTRADGPRAVFCVNDVIAFGVLDAANELGITVPGDLWVVGYDDIKMASWNVFDLTTLTQPVDRIADVSVELLLARMNEYDRSFEHLKFEPRLVVRRSAPGPGSTH